jgi:hypothetical protein
MWRTFHSEARRPGRAAFALALLGLHAGCRQDMHDQPRIEPYEESTFFEDGRGSRDPVEGTVARGQLDADPHFYQGRAPAPPGSGSGGDREATSPPGESPLVDTFPYPVTKPMLTRGRERYDIFCSPCHSRTGNGDGMIVRRGYRRPPPFTSDALRAAPAGHFYDVVTRGFGAMPSYAAQISVGDRWAIVAYVRALQLSQSASLGDVPEADRHLLEPKGTP